MTHKTTFPILPSIKMKKTIINFIVFLLLIPIASPLLALEATDINQAIRDKGAHWVAGETSVSKLPPEEIRRRLMPIKFKKSGQQAKSYRFSAKVNNLPTKIDWRNVNGYNYVTGVRDQGNCGSCWAFGSTAALESRILITSHTPDKDLDLSEQAMVSCDDENMGCSGGFPDSAMSYLKTAGIPLETDAPYNSGRTGITGACAATMQQNTYRVTGFEDVATSVEAIKNAIVQYGPLVTGFVIYTDFLSYQSGVYSHVTGVAEGGHMVAIVGYDDEEQAWIIKNSWGPDWGEGGYFRIKSGTNECDIEDEVYVINYATVPGTSFVLSPSSVDFGTLVLPDQASQTLPFTITNNGSVPLNNISSMVTNPKYSVSPCTVSTLASAALADIQVTYTAHAGKTPDTGELQVVSAGVTQTSSLTAQTNTRPAQPTNLWPSDGATMQLPGKLFASAFVDADGDAHEASQWIIQNASGGIVYSGSFDASGKTSFTVPSGTLQANTQYYWQVIYRDDRGVVSSASALTAFTAASPVPGSKGGCFIATAAFGSPMAGQVEILRQFRDRYLLTNNLGQKFVVWYYRNGPTAANWINDKPLTKAAIRAALYPLIGFSFLLIFGYLPFVIVGLLLTAFLFFRFRPKKPKATS
ncbi:MAG: C1 family peptidase [Smithellaceae bacterium]|nr:C1 family peptidase [Smithellaceae bacterium]